MQIFSVKIIFYNNLNRYFDFYQWISSFKSRNFYLRRKEMRHCEYREEPLLFRLQKDDEVIINETKNIRK